MQEITISKKKLSVFCSLGQDRSQESDIPSLDLDCFHSFLSTFETSCCLLQLERKNIIIKMTTTLHIMIKCDWILCQILLLWPFLLSVCAYSNTIAHTKHWPIEWLIKSHISWLNLAKQIGKHLDNTSINKNWDGLAMNSSAFYLNANYTQVQLWAAHSLYST